MTPIPRLLFLLLLGALHAPGAMLAMSQAEGGTKADSAAPGRTDSSAALAAAQKARPAAPRIGLTIVFAQADASEMGAKLDREGNNPLSAPRGVLFWYDGQIAAPEFLKMKIALPTLAVECAHVGSTTTHPASPQPVTAKWVLAFCGVLVSPRVESTSRRHRLVAHPFGIGIYSIGTPLPAGLSVTDRSGRLDASATAVGAMSRLGIEFGDGPVRGSLEIGYRMLRFSRVALTPRDGFRDRPGGTLLTEFVMPESLDLSGPMITLSTTMRLGGSD